MVAAAAPIADCLDPRLGKGRDSQSEINAETSEGQVMKIGTVRWFNLQKGYGYSHPDDGSPNVFVDKSVVESAGMSNLKGVTGSPLSFNGTSAPATRPPYR